MCGCAHTCVRRAAHVLHPGWGRTGAGGGGWGGMRVRVHVCLSPGGLFRSAECGRVYLISDVPSVFSADINCQTMSNGAQMFPGGGLPSFASTMRVIKNPRGSRVWAAVAAGPLAGVHRGPAGQLPQLGMPTHGQLPPQPLCAGRWARAAQASGSRGRADCWRQNPPADRLISGTSPSACLPGLRQKAFAGCAGLLRCWHARLPTRD